MDATAAEEIKNMRPLPNNMVIIGNKTGVSSLLLKVGFTAGLQLYRKDNYTVFKNSPSYQKQK